MYIAKTYVGTYSKGECIPDNVLNEEQVAWLKSVGAIGEIVPVKVEEKPAETDDAPAKKVRKRRKGVKEDEGTDA